MRILNKLLLVVSIVFTLFGATTFAATTTDYDPLEGACSANKDATACNKQRDNPDALTGSNSIFIKVSQIIVYATAIVSVIMIMIGGFSYVMSSGDPQRINGAKNTILYAIIGLVVATSAQLILGFVLNNIG